MKMKSFTIFLLLLFTAGISSAVDPRLKELRMELPNAFKNEDVCNTLYEKVKDLKVEDPVLRGYIGAVHIARSKHIRLVEKKDAFITGATMLEDAIKDKPDEIELHFLRMTIQLNLPKFLGYNDNIDQDKKFVFDNYKDADPVIKERIAYFVRTSGHFNNSEIAMLN